MYILISKTAPMLLRKQSCVVQFLNFGLFPRTAIVLNISKRLLSDLKVVFARVR